MAHAHATRLGWGHVKCVYLSGLFSAEALVAEPDRLYAQAMEAAARQRQQSYDDG